MSLENNSGKAPQLPVPPIPGEQNSNTQPTPETPTLPVPPIPGEQA